MRWLFLLLSLAAFALGGLVVANAASALHEIESLLLFILAALFLVAFSVAGIRVPKPVDNAEHLAKAVELLEWLKKAKTQELREAAKRANGGAVIDRYDAKARRTTDRNPSITT
jgi:hypothetical protein